MLICRTCAAGEYSLEKDGDAIGRASVQYGRVALFVSEQWQGKGYGTFFLKEVLKLYPAQTLTASPKTPAALALCRKGGFLREGENFVRRIVPEINALTVAHAFLRLYVPQGGFAVDATAGNGHDTALLAQLVGKTGRVLGFDIQPQAVENTNARLAAMGAQNYAKAVCDSHANLATYIAENTLDAAVFNLGYLPGADHALFTTPAVSLPAIETALRLLHSGGVCTVCLYSGGAQGTAERDAALQYFRALDPAAFTVLITEFAGRTGYVPVPVCILKK